MKELEKSLKETLMRIYSSFKNKSEISVFSPDYDKNIIDCLVDQGMIERIDVSTLSGWAYILRPTLIGKQRIEELTKLKSFQVEVFIEQGEEIMKEEIHHISEQGLAIPEYISGPKSDEWFSEIKIFNNQSLSNHPLHDDIDAICTKYKRLPSAHKKMMRLLRALLNDEKLDESLDNMASPNSAAANYATQDNKVPNAFISYSWEDEEHNAWVLTLANSLLNNGIEAIVDQYDALPGDRLTQFMEQSIEKSDYVLIICTPTYKKKSDSREGGVGYEGHIISDALYVGKERKFIPVLRKGNKETAIPTCLAGKAWIDLSNETHYSEEFERLLSTLQGKKKKPPVVQRRDVNR